MGISQRMAARVVSAWQRFREEMQGHRVRRLAVLADFLKRRDREKLRSAQANIKEYEQ